MSERSPNLAVLEQRVEPTDSLDFFPTPPWGTRALFEYIGDDWGNYSCWCPEAGEGHMAEIAREVFGTVYASDVHDYGVGYDVGSFTGVGPDVATWPAHISDISGEPRPDWIVMNPPFNEAEGFFERAIEEATIGVAMLLRTSWVGSLGRYDSIFSGRAPTRILHFVDRLNMVKGRWDPKASRPTEYSWFVWNKITGLGRNFSQTSWIPPGAPKRCSRPDDIARFAKWLAVESSEACVDENQADFWGK